MLELITSVVNAFCRMDVKPGLFSRKKGSKGLESDLCEISIIWDLSMAEFGCGPEPLGGFYVGIVFEKRMGSGSWGYEERRFQEGDGGCPSSL